MWKKLLKGIGFAVAVVAINAGVDWGQTIFAGSPAVGHAAPFTSTGLVMPSPKQQWLDNNGHVLNGGKLYSYAAGTTTPQTTYTDAALSVPNANPVVADSAGRMTVYLALDTAYKFVLKTSGDVTLWTQDDVSLPSSVTPPSPLAVPPGSVLTYGGAAAPTGYVLGDGTAIDRVVYSALFTAIGTTYGVGDGVTTFNVPDCRGRFPLFKAAAGTGSTMGGTGGAIDHTHTYTQVLNHTHTVTVTDPGHNHTQNAHGHTITITDPGHVHASVVDNGSNKAATGPDFDTVTGGNTSSATTGITATNSSTTATNNSATTGVTATTANPAGGVASGTTAAQNPPYLVFQCIVKT